MSGAKEFALTIARVVWYGSIFGCLLYWLLKPPCAVDRPKRLLCNIHFLRVIS